MYFKYKLNYYIFRIRKNILKYLFNDNYGINQVGLERRQK